MDTQNLKNLLSKVSSILKKYENQIALTGENFNIFQLLGVQYNEVNTHTAIITDLLNPQGSHGQGYVFLDAFIRQFDIESFDLKSATCQKEKYIGKKTDDSGGRIDIFIEDKFKKRIFIENKIYASDQENQLLRYCNYDKKAQVFYLTLDGNEPSDYSKGELNSPNDFKNLSYAFDIIKWLESCRKEAATVPVLRETITQYINLIKILTNQATDSNMSKEITDTILKSDDSLEAYFKSYSNIYDVKDNIIQDFGVQLENLALKVGKEKNIKLHFYFTLNRNFGESGFYFATEFMEKCEFQIAFNCELKETRDFFFGFHTTLSEKLKMDAKLIQMLETRFDSAFKNESSSVDMCWIAWQWHKTRNWTYNTYLEIYRGEFVKDIEDKLRTMLDIVKSIEDQSI